MITIPLAGFPMMQVYRALFAVTVWILPQTSALAQSGASPGTAGTTTIPPSMPPIGPR